MAKTSQETVLIATDLIQALPDDLDPLDVVMAFATAMGISLQFALNAGAIGAGRAQQTFDLAMGIAEELACLPVERDLA